MELEEALRRRRVTQPQLPALLAGLPAITGGVMSLPPVPTTTAPFNPAAVGPPPTIPATRPRTMDAAMQGPPVRIGNEVPADASRLQQLMAEHATLSQADPSSKVKRTGWGYEEMPPEQSPSRVRQALTGALHGAAMAGAGGDPWAALGGAATGAAAGGISPALMQAFQRRLELDRSTGDLATEQKLQLGNAQIGETLAQAEQRRLEPFLKAEELRRQDERAQATEEGRNRRNEATNRTRAQTAAEANKARQATLAETERHNRAMEGRPGTNTEEITVAGRKFKVSPNTAARILADREKLRSETDIEADLETEAANDHLTRRREADEQVSKLRAEREKLTHSSKQLADGTWGWQEDPRKVDRNLSSIRALDRQIATAEQESAYRQREADSAFGRARKAQAKGATPPTGGGGGRTLEGAVQAFRDQKKREPTAEEVTRMKRALGQ